jgi:hypothetical protein
MSPAGGGGEPVGLAAKTFRCHRTRPPKSKGRNGRGFGVCAARAPSLPSVVNVMTYLAAGPPRVCGCACVGRRREGARVTVEKCVPVNNYDNNNNNNNNNNNGADSNNNSGDDDPGAPQRWIDRLTPVCACVCARTRACRWVGVRASAARQTHQHQAISGASFDPECRRGARACAPRAWQPTPPGPAEPPTTGAPGPR